MYDALIAALRARARDPARSTDQADVAPGVARPPLSEAVVTRAEAVLGRRLPSLLRAAFLQVGNGGFGPGYGVLPLLSEGDTFENESVVDLYASFASPDLEDPAWVWPAHLLPFCDWGCAIRSCVDCSSMEGAVVTFDPNVYEPGKALDLAFCQTHPSLQAWFSDWIAGVNIWEVMFAPDLEHAMVGVNPFTKEPFTITPAKLRRSD